MSRTPLTPAEIKHRLIRLNNLERLYAKQAQSNMSLKDENRLLRTQMTEMKQVFEKLIERQQIRIAELEKMVFGRRPKGKDGSSSDPGSGAPSSGSKSPRSKDSYRRRIPPESSVTSTELVPVSGCHSCGGNLIDIQIHPRYVEDVLLPALMEQGAKTVTKLEVEQGYCVHCG